MSDFVLRKPFRKDFETAFKSIESACPDVQAEHQARLLEEARDAPTRWVLAFVEAPALLKPARRRADAPVGTRPCLGVGRRGAKRGAGPSRRQTLTAKLDPHGRCKGAYAWHYSGFEVHNMPLGRTDSGEASYGGASGSSAAHPTEKSSPVIVWVMCQILHICSHPTATRYCVHWILL